MPLLTENQRAPRCHWFALRVASRMEFSVAEALDARGIEQFLPTWAEEVRWSDRKKIITRPLLPGYILVRAATIGLLDLFSIRGVLEVLGSTMHPTPIDDAEVENFRRVVTAPVKASPHAYVVGEAITVASGPMAGTTGVIRRVKGATRLIVAITMLQRAVSVEIDAASVTRGNE